MTTEKSRLGLILSMAISVFSCGFILWNGLNLTLEYPMLLYLPLFFEICIPVVIYVCLYMFCNYWCEVSIISWHTERHMCLSWLLFFIIIIIIIITIIILLYVKVHIVIMRSWLNTRNGYHVCMLLGVCFGDECMSRFCCCCVLRCVCVIHVLPHSYLFRSKRWMLSHFSLLFSTQPLFYLQSTFQMCKWTENLIEN